MELRTYWGVVWRWRWLVLAVAAVTFVATMGIQSREPVQYQTTVRLALNPSLPMTSSPEYSAAMHEYYEYLVGEYLNDDIAEVVQGAGFQQAARERASAALGRPVGGVVDFEKVHKLMMFTITADDADQAKALGTAVAEMLTEPGGEYLQPFVSFEPLITLVEEPQVQAAVPPSRALLFLLLRVVLGLIAGFGLAFLLEYLDDSLRTPREVERVIGIPVLAEIPRPASRTGVPRAAGQAGDSPRAQVAGQ